MRPVAKLAAPRTYAAYEAARDDLEAQIGRYCSYCERRVTTHLAVEHVLPQQYNPSLVLDWGNFTLACVNCNSCKRRGGNIVLQDYYWPHLDNTFRVLDWSQGLVRPVQGLPTAVATLAEKTIWLTGLDVDPGNPDPKCRPDAPGKSDNRYDSRFELWNSAKRSRARLANNPSAELREEIAERAAGMGMFSIWMKVFENDQDMRLRLIGAFLGTAQDCFDSSGLPIPSPRGRC